MLLVPLVALSFLAGCTPANQSLDLVTISRWQNGLAPLTPHDMLMAKAQGWADHMASQCNISHSNLREGLPPGWRSAGENVGMAADIGEAHRDWMKSTKGHREAILSRTYTHIGAGVAFRNCGGIDRAFVVLVFVQL
jgi:uncharacterized protein YkwD